MDLHSAFQRIETFSTGDDLAEKLFDLEYSLSQATVDEVVALLQKNTVDDSALWAAFLIKEASAQIDVIIHGLGILIALPHIMEPEEKIEYLSLGAGNTGRRFDLETDRRVAEFKFIQWKGGSESIRQNSLFNDLFNLIAHGGGKRKYLYVINKKHPLKFLANKRSLNSVLSKNDAVKQEFFSLYGSKYRTVSEYYADVRDLVEIVDVRDVVPAFARIR